MRSCETCDLRRSRIAHWRRPALPGKRSPFLQLVLVECLEQREIGERLPAAALKSPEFLSDRACRSPVRPELVRVEPAEQRFQYGFLAGCDCSVVNERGRTRSPMSGPEPSPLHQLVHRRILGEAGDRSHIDIEIIEMTAARRRIRADMPWLSREQRVQRIDAENRSGISAGRSAEPSEIAEIANAPVPVAAQSI